MDEHYVRRISGMKNIFKPLSDNELDWLDHFLLQRIDEYAGARNKDEGILNVSELDGLFTAIVSGPEMIRSAHWLPQVWGDFEPEWSREEEFETVLSLMLRHMNSIAATLMVQPQNFEPMFIESVIDDQGCTVVEKWCEGFMRGVLLAAEQWHMDDMNIEILLVPIKAFAGKQAVRTRANFSKSEIENIQNAICLNAREVFNYWLTCRQDAVSTVESINHIEPCRLHNAPCSCSRGEKYRKCRLH
jgi:uncharacterized protein